ncbi:hypothetical protein FOL47_000151 [Perkinsus chesapeaki]|uniref:Uncharacterized protein n=1 Tax=Perkinsus chesapeaki TaxID=330153 RepID=A0A7J6MN29_PERCH|nr:hypothetical protein FOL47_000151 [Perkinsus chesapeaki]
MTLSPDDSRSSFETFSVAELEIIVTRLDRSISDLRRMNNEEEAQRELLTAENKKLNEALATLIARANELSIQWTPLPKVEGDTGLSALRRSIDQSVRRWMGTYIGDRPVAKVSKNIGELRPRHPTVVPPPPHDDSSVTYYGRDRLERSEAPWGILPRYQISDAGNPGRTCIVKKETERSTKSSSRSQSGGAVQQAISKQCEVESDDEVEEGVLVSIPLRLNNGGIDTLRLFACEAPKDAAKRFCQKNTLENRLVKPLAARLEELEDNATTLPLHLIEPQDLAGLLDDH